MATGTLVTEKIYLPLLRLLAEKEHEALAALPRPLQELPVLAAAWTEGCIEFGRQDQVVTSPPAADSIAHTRHTILEDGYNWTGPRQARHKPLAALLAEEKTLPTNCVNRVVEKSPDTRTQKISYRAADNKALGLRVRLTDRGLAALAA